MEPSIKSFVSSQGHWRPCFTAIEALITKAAALNLCSNYRPESVAWTALPPRRKRSFQSNSLILIVQVTCRGTEERQG